MSSSFRQSGKGGRGHRRLLYACQRSGSEPDGNHGGAGGVRSIVAVGDWVSAVAIRSSLGEMCILAGELLVVASTLWLLFLVLKQMGVFGKREEATDAVC